MNNIIVKYKHLKSQLINEDCEQCIGEVMWNDCIIESMEELLQNVNTNVAKQIRLNHL